VGLHAMTNFVRPGVKGTPLGKLLRQLRIERDEFALCEQKRSRIAFGPRGEAALHFTNDFAVLEAEVGDKFPSQIDGFRRLVTWVKTYDDVSLDARPESARDYVRRFISDPLLENMLFCPLMYYGSAQEHDMEFGQFVIMFKALFLEGFARPLEGVRVILRVLLEKYREAGGERRMKCGVSKITLLGNRAAALVLDDGSEVTATQVLSTVGGPETEALLSPPSSLVAGTQPQSEPGKLSFVETITVLDRAPAELGWGDDTIIFFNDSAGFDYACPAEQVDPRSGVICFPNNFAYPVGQQLPEGLFRCTCLANYQRWAILSEEQYQADKHTWYQRVTASARRFLPPLPPNSRLEQATIATDMFTPRTVEKFTGHKRGAIYGSAHKHRRGDTAVANLFLCGTDQGFLGIVGAMLSGISMANFHILQKS
jgi:phytoene dehydrogenase-like protein